jgi:hypothetical protein
MKREKPPEVEHLTLVREVIASGSVTRLDRCRCGDLYLTVGPITLALHPDALADLSATLGRACAALARGPDARQVLPGGPAARDTTSEAGGEPPSETDPSRPPAGEVN